MGIDSEKLKFVSSSNIYQENNGAIVLAKESKDESYIKAHCCQVSLVQEARWKEICDLEDRFRKSEGRYFNKCLQGQMFVRIRNLRSKFLILTNISACRNLVKMSAF